MLLRRDEEVGGEDGHLVQRLEALAAHGIDGLYRLDLVVEEGDAVAVVPEGGHDVEGVALDTERRGRHVGLGACVERLHQAVHEVLVVDHVARAYLDRGGVKVVRVADTVEARYARYDDHVAPARQKRGRGVQTQFVQLVVYGQILLDICVRGGEVGFGLVVVVIRDEILDGILRKEVLEFAVELCREGLVMAQDKGRAVEVRHHVGYGEGLARARHAEQHLIVQSHFHAFDQRFDRFGLVARGRIIRHEFEIHAAKVTKNSLRNDKGRVQRPCLFTDTGHAAQEIKVRHPAPCRSRAPRR